MRPPPPQSSQNPGVEARPRHPSGAPGIPRRGGGPVLGCWTQVGGHSPATLLAAFHGFHRQRRRPRLGVGRLPTKVSEARNAEWWAGLQNLCLPRPADPQHTHTHTPTHTADPQHTHTHTHTLRPCLRLLHPPTCPNSRGGWPRQSVRRCPAPTAHLEKWPRHLGAGPEERQRTTEGRRGHLPNKGGRASNRVEEGASQAPEAPEARLTASPT